MSKFTPKNYIIKNDQTDEWVENIQDTEPFFTYTDKRENALPISGRGAVHVHCKQLREKTGHIHVSIELK